MFSLLQKSFGFDVTILCDLSELGRFIHDYSMSSTLGRSAFGFASFPYHF